jgi:hypothetical protein
MRVAVDGEDPGTGRPVRAARSAQGWISAAILKAADRWRKRSKSHLKDKMPGGATLGKVA